MTPGSRIGPYEIGGSLGAGGMGEVYRATDTKLKREVAIKVLPAALAADPDRLARFQREAEVLASLNHQNIAHIHGLEDADGIKALVMELVEGPTLAERLATGGSGLSALGSQNSAVELPLDETLAIAKQIAEALEAAHEQGIVHRDLKPANIKVRPDGTVKVLDFGLAKAMDPVGSGQRAVGSGPESMSPTITTPAMTQMGMILGTAAYMSPEQAKGRPADKRSDIWAFGCVLYEMLTGRRAFDGEDMVDVLGAVARLEPDWAAMPLETPAIIRTLVRRCLEKDPRRRIADISTALFVMKELQDPPSDPAVRLAVTQPLWRRAIPVLLAAIFAAAIAGAGAWTIKPSAPPLPVMRSRFILPDGQGFTNDARQSSVAIAPDGTQMVYVANGRLFLRSLSELEAKPIQGSEGALLNGVNSPTFSPDGRSIAYWDGALRKIATGGGAAVTLARSDRPWGINWSADDIVYGLGAKGIMRVSANGGMPEQTVSVESTELASEPQMLPGNRVVLFTLGTGVGGGTGRVRWDTARIVVHTLGSGERKTIIEGGSHARYVPTGHIVYAFGGALFAVTFDATRLEVTGSPVPVLEGVKRSVAGNVGTGSAHYSVSSTGSLVFVPGPVSSSLALREIVRMNRTGGVEPLPLPPNAYDTLRLSPDGRRVAFDTDDGNEAIVWVSDLSGTSAPRRLTFGGGNRFPIWSSDGQWVVFQSDREGDLGLFRQRADGTGTAERLTKADQGTAHVAESWSPSGEKFLFSALEGSKGVSLWTFSVQDRKAVPFGDVRSTAPLNSEFSPDGRWVAYTLRPGSGANVYVEPFPPTGAKYQITTQNGHHPVWLPDGKGLSYRVDTNQQDLVTVDTTQGFSFSNPVRAMTGTGLPVIGVGSSRTYDITRDGTAFVTVAPASSSQAGLGEAREIQIVLNWFEELKRLAPSN